MLGAMMISSTAIAMVTEVLAPGDFYRESHGKIYRAAVALYLEGKPVDPVTLADALAERGDLELVGGKVRIAELAHQVTAASNAAHHAKIVRDMAVLRGLVRAGSEIVRLGYERGDQTENLVAQAEQILFEVSQARTPGELTLLKDALMETFDRLTELYETKREVTGVASGFVDLDRVTAGFQPGNLILLAARPSMGKSALALNIAINVALQTEKQPCAFFALEMSRQEIVQRLISSDGKLETHSIRTGNLRQDDWPRVVAACSKLEQAPLYIDDTPALTMLELRARVQTLKRREPALALVVIDYLQLMAAGVASENRLQEISTISRGLKALARDLDVPVLALSQLSRAVESRPDKRPLLSDLRESGTLEQDADVVLLLYRDDYYNKENSESPGLAELHVAKHRNGPTDTVQFSFLRRFTKFANAA